ncbi:MAG: hypothetical protein HY397_00460 [Candidatus Doudnabacteria bacterium]|nr:hypothetical protein [Candidatus Doudnabacteria bacterium]
MNLIDSIRKNSKLSAAVFTFIALCILAFITYRQYSITPTGPEQAVSTPSNLATGPATNATNQNAKPATKKSAPAATLSYEDLVKQYQGRRIQFDANCRATPSYLTVKAGTSVMLDNRYGASRVVVVDGKPSTLNPFGYALVSLNSKTLPHTIQLDCGNGKNTARILLQL